MEITEVRVKLMDEPGERLQAFCSITFDDAFVVRDLKIIGGATGPFVAMPSRKLTGTARSAAARIISVPPFAITVAPAERTIDRQGRGRPRQALCRHRPSDQLTLPRDDPAAGHPSVRGRKGPLETAGLRAQL